WALLLVTHVYRGSFENFPLLGGHLLGPIPQMVMGIAMVMVLYEQERRTVQESLLGFSSLQLDASSIHEAVALEAEMHQMLDRMLAPMEAPRGLIWVSDAWRRTLPAAQRGFPATFMDDFAREQCGEYLLEQLGRGKEKLVFKNLDTLTAEDF